MTESQAPNRFGESAETDAVSQELRELFSSLPAPSAPPTAVIQRLGERVEAGGLGSHGPLGHPVILGTLAAVATLVVGALATWLHASSRGAVSDLVMQPTPIEASAPPVPVVALAPKPVQEVVSPKAAPKPAQSGVRLRLAAAPAEVAQPDKPVVTAPAETEAAALSRALRALHQQSNPQGALAALSEYFAAFPDGQLRPEARLAEIEALVAAGKIDEAIQRLQPETIRLLPRSTELFVLRGELLARQHRCTEALVAFGQAAERLPTDEALLQRVSRGREFCRASENGEPDESP